MKELELILAAVAQLGEAGKEAFIWWLVIDRGLAFLAIMAGFMLLAYAMRQFVKHLSSEEKLKHLRDSMGVGSSGFFTESEYTAMVRWVESKK